MVTLLDLCVSSLRSDHANLLCIVPMLGCTRHPEIVSRPGPPWPCKKNWLRFSILVCEKMFTLLDFGVQKIVYTSRFWCAKNCLHFSILVCKQLFTLLDFGVQEKMLTLLDFGVQKIVYTSRFLYTKKRFTLIGWCVSSLRKGHANLLCIVPMLECTRSSLLDEWNVWWGKSSLVARRSSSLVARRSSSLVARRWSSLVAARWSSLVVARRRSSLVVVVARRRAIVFVACRRSSPGDRPRRSSSLLVARRPSSLLVDRRRSSPIDRRRRSSCLMNGMCCGANRRWSLVARHRSSLL